MNYVLEYSKRFKAVFIARNREFWRDKAVLGWNFIFPFFIVLAISLIFSNNEKPLYKIGLFETDTSSSEFFQTRYIQFIPFDNLQEGLFKVQRHQIDMLVSTPNQSLHYWVNSSSPNGYLLEKMLPKTDLPLHREVVIGQEIRYVDWLIPGILGMNLMFSCLFGAGFTIVRYRKNGFLKRLRATPLSAKEFLFAQILSRLFLILIVSIGIYIGCYFMVGFNMLGSYFNLLLMTIAGIFCLTTLGILFSSRGRSEELINGLLNMAIWPMMLLSEVWFSLEGAPQWIQQIALLFPLTHFVQAAREIMTEGASLLQVMDHFCILLTMSVVFLSLGSWLFRWE
jgi:ABC-2 type transport system permease protein